MVGESRDLTRRRLLQAGTRITALGVVGTVAGCGFLENSPQNPAEDAETAFDISYVGGLRELQITHRAGTAISGSNLFVEGQDIETGRWDRLGGTTSAETDSGSPAVVPGDRLTLSEAKPDYGMWLVWNPDDHDSSALATDEGPGTPEDRLLPQVRFVFDYDAEARELTAIHEGGNGVFASELSLRGEGIEAGRWDRLDGTASSQMGDTPVVVAGDRLTLSEVPPDYEIRLVWEPTDRYRVALAPDAGPEIYG